MKSEFQIEREILDILRPLEIYCAACFFIGAILGIRGAEQAGAALIVAAIVAAHLYERTRDALTRREHDAARQA
jgi:hypothetical protein